MKSLSAVIVRKEIKWGDVKGRCLADARAGVCWARGPLGGRGMGSRHGTCIGLET